ncbi:flagellar hook-length control protein [Cronobacter sakazakii]|nr:flagellar hook-length control protein [Cronobacter sakazakii]
MITLPNVVLTSDVDATGTGAGLKGVDAKSGDAAQDFLALLGQHFSGKLPFADAKRCRSRSCRVPVKRRWRVKRWPMLRRASKACRTISRVCWIN